MPGFSMYPGASPWIRNVECAWAAVTLKSPDRPPADGRSRRRQAKVGSPPPSTPQPLTMEQLTAEVHQPGGQSNKRFWPRKR